MRISNKILSLVFFLLMSNIAIGQPGTLYEYPISGTDNIIRFDAMSNQYIIYTSVPGNQNHFSMTDFNNTIDIRICDKLTVTDFEIIDRYVFFCGNEGSSTGVIGWFHIDSLFSHLSKAYIDKTLYILGLQTLDNIEVYHDSLGNICIAGYGIHNAYPHSTMYRAFEAVGTPTTGMQYRTMDLYYSGWYEHVTDLTVTNNFVVYVSDTRNQLCPGHVGLGIFLHVFPKYNQFGSYPNYLHFYQLTTNSTLYPSYVLPIIDDPHSVDPDSTKPKPKIVYSTDDIVAVCTYRKDLDDSGWNPPAPDESPACGSKLPSIKSFITNIRFDVSTLVSNLSNQVPMLSYDIAELPNYELISIDDILYEPQTMRYVALHSHETNTSVDKHAVTIFDFSTGIAAPFTESYYHNVYPTNSVWQPTNICLDNNMQYTIIGDMSSVSNVLWHNTVIPSVSPCETMVNYPVTHQPLMPEKTEINPAYPTNWLALNFLPETVIDNTEIPCHIICN